MCMDYYPEYQRGESMDLTQEISDLKEFYKSRVDESYQALNEYFLNLVGRMETFLQAYREHEKYCDSYNNLVEKIQEDQMIKSGKSFQNCINEMRSEDEDEV